MRLGFASLFSCALACAMACGCSDGPDPARDAGSDAGMSGVDWVTKVTEFVPGVFDGDGLEGVEVCVEPASPPSCFTTDDEGHATLRGLPPAKEVLIVYRKEGYRPVLLPFRAPRFSSDAGFEIRMFGVDMELPYPDAAPKQDWETLGEVAFGRFNQSGGFGLPPQAFATLEPSSGEGPYLVNQAEDHAVPAPSDEQTQYGVYLNVEPGDYELVYNDASGRCEWYPGPQAGWQAKSGRKNAARTVVRAGHITWPAAVFCADVSGADAGADADAGAE